VTNEFTINTKSYEISYLLLTKYFVGSKVVT